MKFVPKDKGNSADNSSGGGTDGFIKEALLMIAAHIGVGYAATLLVLLGLVLIAGTAALAVWLIGG